VVLAFLGPNCDFGILDLLAYLGVVLMNRKFVRDKIKRRIIFKEFLLLFGPESFVFLVPV